MVVLSYYQYSPSVAAAVVFAVLYCAASIATIFLWIKYRAWVWFVMVLAGLMESVGYISRIRSAKNVDDRGIYIVMFCLIILAPVLMAAALYIIFGRIVFHVLPPSARTTKLLWVPPRFVTPIFVVCDIIAFFIQLIGAVIVAGTQPTDHDAATKLKKGKNIVLIGLAVQIACFGLFSVVAIRFHFTSRRFEKEFDRRVGGGPGDKYYAVDDRKAKLLRTWPALLAAINIGCGMILIRSVYRVVDFSMGKRGFMERHEYFFYIFDSLPIFLCVASFVWFHPGKYLPYLGYRLPKHIRNAPGDYESSISMVRQGY